MRKPVKVLLTVEAEIEPNAILDAATIREDLANELVKVKSGPYNNMFYGEIVDVDIVSN